MDTDKVAEVEVWVSVGDTGTYYVAVAEDDLAAAVDAGDGALSRRTIKLVLTVPLPQTLEVRGEVPSEAGGTVELRVQGA